MKDLGRKNSPTYSQKMNLPIPTLPRISIAQTLAETDYFIGQGTESKASLHGATFIEPKTNKGEILIFIDNIERDLKGDKAKTKIARDTTIANELGNYYFHQLLDPKYLDSSIKGIVSVLQISEAFSDLFSLQTGGNQGFQMEAFRIADTQTYEYSFSRTILINALNKYAKEEGQSTKEIGNWICKPANTNTPEMNKVREAVIKSYLNNSAIQAALKGTLYQHLTP